jgi:hypothetical protein
LILVVTKPETAIPFRRTIAAYEMLILVASIPNLAPVFRASHSIGFYAAVFLIACGAVASAFAGWLLWRGDLLGCRLSLALQWLLLLHFVWPGVAACSVSLGLSTLVSWGTKPAGIMAPAHVIVGLGPSDAAPYFGVNVLALFALVFLYRNRAERRKVASLAGPAI